MSTMHIGWIGTGVMGNAMCGHMIAAGHRVHVYTRTRDKAANLLSSGAQWCDSPQAVARNSAVIFSIVGSPQDVQETILGSRGVLEGARTGAVIIDMTTSSPGLAANIL
jgi:3-hydroxyisobutyrate dehydrogenase